MIITISGVPSSGKSTIAKRLSASLGWPRYSVGDIMKEMAGSKHINQFYKELEDNPSLERKIDLRQKEWGEADDDFIIEGRTSFYFMPSEKSFNVFFNLNFEEAARRAYNRSEHEDKGKRYESLDAALHDVYERMKIENERYKSLYGFDHLDMKNYDYIVDASLSPDKVYDALYARVLKEIETRK
ncbi:MAG: cytidylate kinase family protein [Nanoarchaeota archaeon]